MDGSLRQSQRNPQTWDTTTRRHMGCTAEAQVAGTVTAPVSAVRASPHQSSLSFQWGCLWERRRGPGRSSLEPPQCHNGIFRGNSWERPSSGSPGVPSAGRDGLVQLRKGGLWWGWRQLRMCVCVSVLRARARVRACVRACVCGCVCVCVSQKCGKA